jgi:3'-phosphoadenosine 5'-phosphosulfate sulfotransferase (PAPS reductase)/FAD synthetase
MTFKYSDPTPELREEVRRKIDGRPVVVSISGGKDSTAASMLMRDLGVPVHSYLHLSTGWESETTEEYIQHLKSNVLTDAPFVIRGRPGGMEELVRKHAYFPNRLARFCTKELKIDPAKAYYKEVCEQEQSDIVCVVGIRAAESASRAVMAEWEESGWFDGVSWRPLIDASGTDVISLHSAHGTPPNPMYMAGSQRVGCWPCIHSRKAEIRLWAKDKAAVKRLEVLEADVNAEHARRVADPGYRRSDPDVVHGFFTCRKVEPGTKSRKPQWPLQKVLKWAHSGKGEQPRMFDPEDVAGCMRWGLCEAVAPD